MDKYGNPIKSNPKKDRYFITRDGVEREVTKQQYISAEQGAGFRSKFGPDEVATASFSNSRQNISGRIEYGS